MRTFARLGEHHYKQIASDPSARERFEAVKSAYETLTDYNSRLRYNIEHGLAEPPKPSAKQERTGLVGQLAILVPENWPVLLPWLTLWIGGNVGYYLLVGELPWACWGCSSAADYMLYAMTATVVLVLIRLLWRWD